jgi:hypothetical protein
MSKRCVNNKSEYEEEGSTNKKYKTSDIILIDDEYCVGCNFYDKTNIFTRWYVDTQCPFCDVNITECLEFVSDYNSRTVNNKIDLIIFFKHLRKSHSENFITIKNIESDMKKEIIKFTLVKKVIL